METLRSKVIKLAHEHPEFRNELLPVLGKTAFSPTSEDFVAWVMLMAKKYTPDEVQEILEKQGVPLLGSVEARRGPLSVGELVSVDVNVNTNEQNEETCREYHRQTGRVVDKDHKGYTIEMDQDHKKIFFYGVQPGKETGLGRFTPIGSGVEKGTEGKVHMECVYLKDKNGKLPTKTHMEIIDDYVEAGSAQGESRYSVYFSGLVPQMRMTKEGNLVFGMYAVQRVGHPTTFNPTKGTVLYLGRQGGRPSGWKADWADFVRDMEDVNL